MKLSQDKTLKTSLVGSAIQPPDQRSSPQQISPRPAHSSAYCVHLLCQIDSFLFFLSMFIENLVHTWQFF